MSANAERRNFRIVGPDETESNRLGAVLEVTDKVWPARIDPVDQHLASRRRVMELLSEHTCQAGWISLSINEIRHLFAKLITNTVRTIIHWLQWSQWRRQHQTRARISHYARQTRASDRHLST